MDELMMDWLYDELDPPSSARVAEHVGHCARCSAELGALRRTREAFRGLPEAEPPPSLSAILLHEAARRAPSVQAGVVVVAAPVRGDTGLWARIAAWLRPLALHPSIAAAAALLLVAGVAGALYVRRGAEIHVPARHSGADLPPPPTASGEAEQGEANQASTPASGTETASPAPAPSEDPSPEKQLAQPATTAPSASTEADGDREEEPARDPERSSGYAAGVLDDQRQADVGAAQGVDRAAGVKGAEKKKTAVPDVRDGRFARYRAKGDAYGDQSRDKAPAEKPARLARNDRKEANAVGGAANARPADAKLAKDEAKLEAGPGGPVAGRGADTATGSAPPAQSAAPAAPRPETRAQAADELADAEPAGGAPVTVAGKAREDERARKEQGWLQAQEGKLAALVKSGRCREAATVANDILDRNAAYYTRRVVGARVAGRCQRYVGDEQRRRSTRRASKNAASAGKKVKAAPEADRASAQEKQ